MSGPGGLLVLSTARALIRCGGGGPPFVGVGVEPVRVGAGVGRWHTVGS